MQKTFQQIVKRDGTLVAFDSEKITHAILAAGEATGEFGAETAKNLTNLVINLARKTLGEKTPSVEEIQDLVERVLLQSPYMKTAKAYILYRDQHHKIREITTKASINLIDQYISQSDWRVSENSNMSYSLQGLNNYISSEVSKVYWLNKIYPPEIREAHICGEFHIHDLNSLSVYCVGWDLHDLLVKGFGGVSGKVESSPAKHFRTALGQVTNFFYTLQGEAAGAQAFSSFDTLLAPFIRYDHLTYKEVKQAMQEFVFNINVPTRTGFQTPFTNVTMDLQPSSNYANEPVIIGGEPQPETYGEFQHEMNLLNRAFFEVMTEGDAKGRVFTFPIPTYNITKDFDWDNPELDLLWEVTGKYGIPYFSNFVNSDMNPEDARSMCCRLRLDNRELRKRGGGLFGANPLTGSIGVVTLNLPRAAYQAQDESAFFERLGKLADLASNSLEIKRKVLENYTEGNFFPYSKFYLADIKSRFNRYWENHFSTIGIVGLNEACLNLLGEDIGSAKGNEFSVKVMDFLREKISAIQERTGNNYNLEATPAEGTAYRLAKLDKKTLAGIQCANETRYQKGDEPYYTNSAQLPVNYTDDPFELLDLQDELQTKFTGGTVVHVFVGERIHSKEAVKQFVKTVCMNYKLPYFSLTPTFSVCPTHGYIAGEHETCPSCGTECEIYSRVVGYLRPVKQWNNGKKSEYSNRRMLSVV
ncbi:anaerobic ribonucleoside-triphosphate reductase [Chloroherpeton thalassium ATCC 35110]|uniref:Anaerobic ribonucleoside-triphosphate reductase n=1 Tax=Chloroherpeton thalassium (strain ATCC 35110 / GB-78) TaxID=517418 RepID=B3QVU7_CHLT3|nr:ribonucleoside triphosphate reductase [Chloroherpeton thalassium]ACF13154.1 anaerobic ribonucleoside-triphosphate reductase [Chloroherpeton thalassium ATCC 35110]